MTSSVPCESAVTDVVTMRRALRIVNLAKALLPFETQRQCLTNPTLVRRSVDEALMYSDTWEDERISAAFLALTVQELVQSQPAADVALGDHEQTSRDAFARKINKDDFIEVFDFARCEPSTA